MARHKGDFSYSPGQLGKKLGVTATTVKRYLKKTGLINQCYKDDNNWWRIPQRVAVKFISPESLAVQKKNDKRKKEC